MGDVSENGTTVLISSHNLRELEDVCDHVGIMHKGKMMLERRLSDLQENVVKVQVVFADGRIPERLKVLHESEIGRIKTLIIRGKREETENIIAAAGPLFYDIIPLTLEEIFISEMGDRGYDFEHLLA